MKKVIFLLAMVLGVSYMANAGNRYVNMTISAADDTTVNGDTANLYYQFASGVNYPITIYLKGVKASGTVGGGHVTLWGRNASTQSYVQITTSNSDLKSYNASNDSLLVTTTNEHTFTLGNSHFTDIKVRYIVVGTVTVAVTGRIDYFPSAYMKLD